MLYATAAFMRKTVHKVFICELIDFDGKAHWSKCIRARSRRRSKVSQIIREGDGNIGDDNI